MHNACRLHRVREHLPCPSLCTIEPHLILRWSHSIFPIISQPAVEERNPSALTLQYDFVRQCHRASSCGNSHDQEIIYFVWSLHHRCERHLQYFMHFEGQLYTSSAYAWEGGTIYNSTQAFWRLLPGGFWPFWFFFFLRPFRGPSLPLLILLTLAHQSNSERFGVQVCFRHTSVLNGVCVCVLREQQESSCRALGITHRGVLGNVCVSEEQASRKLETHKSHLI